VNAARFADSVAEGDFARALGAAFDAGLDGEVDVEASIAAVDHAIRGAAEAPRTFDELCVRVGLGELVAARLEMAGDDLPAEQRAAIVMRYYLDMTDDEMSSRLEVARATVRWRLHAARQKLRGLLPGWLGPAAEQQGQAETEAGPVGVAVYANRGDTI